jgi:hypothetical protein
LVSVLVVVAVVRGVPVSVMDVVDVVAVGDGDMTAAVTVGVVGVLVGHVLGGLALVPVSIVAAVQVAVVHVVEVVSVRNHDVATAFAVGMGVRGMLDVGGGHRRTSYESVVRTNT